MVLHLLNTSIVPSAGGSWVIGVYEVSTEAARNLIESVTSTPGSIIQSHVGHASTATWMSEALGMTVPMDRTPMKLTGSDVALVFQLRGRGEEGRIYTLEELQAIGFDFRVMTFRRTDSERRLEDTSQDWSLLFQ